jgi:hypothetical protein
MLYEITAQHKESQAENLRVDIKHAVSDLKGWFVLINFRKHFGRKNPHNFSTKK